MGVKLGQKWAVKDGNLLASNQVGSRFFNKEFDFSRASNGTYVDRDGLLKTAELYNLLSYSEDFSGYTNGNSTDEANATISPSGVQNATSFLEAATTGQHKLTTSFSFDGSSTYTFSIYAKTNGRDLYIDTQNSNEWGGRAWFDLTEGTANSVLGSASIQDVGNGWYRCIVTGASTLLGGNLIELLTSNGSSNSTTGDTTKGVYIYGAQLVEGTEPLDYQYTNGLQGLPRISFEDGVGHLLLEPQRSNQILHSNSFNNWVVDDATRTSGQSGVYGSNDAWLLQQNTNSSRHHIRRTLTPLTGQYSFSLYAKAKELHLIQIASIQTTEEYANFDLSDGSIGNVGSRFLDAKATSVGNGWYRLSVYTDNGCNAFYISLIESKTDAWLPSYSGANSTDGLYIQHAQLESGSYPTSVIETTTTSVTRLADVCNNSGSAQDFNSEEGVLYAEIARGGDANDEYQLISIMDSTDTIRVGFGKQENTTNWYIRVIIDALQMNVNAGEFEEGFQKIAIKYKSGDSAVWLNGVEINTNTTAFSNALSFSELKFNWTGSNFPFYGKVRNLQVFTEALSDAELQQLTT